MAANKTIRWLEILRLLESEENKWWTTSEIHESLQNSLSKQGVQLGIRTTQRDMVQIGASGLVELGKYSGDEPGGKWRLVDSEINVDKKRFSSPDLALILLLASRHLSLLLPIEVQQRLNELAVRSEAHFKNQTLPAHWVRPWQNKIRVMQRGHALLQPKLDPEVIGDIYQALDRHKKLRLSYYKPGRAAQIDVYQPLGLVFKPPLFYLVVLREGNPRPHNLAVHRITKAEVLIDDSVASPGFDLDHYLESGGMEKIHGKNVKLVVRTNHKLSDHWESAHIGRDQTIEKNNDDSVITAYVEDTDSLRRYLLGFGSQIRVLSPDSISTWIANEVRAMAVLHSKAK